MNTPRWPKLGCGLGLRTKHYPDILSTWPKVDWFEAITENYMDSGGKPLAVLEEIRQHYPIALHGVALSIGSADPLNEKYLKKLKTLVERIQPVIVSDHLCWSGVGGEQLHDLLPLPFTEESVKHVVSRVLQIQEFLGRAILLENVSTYVTYKHSVMPEWEFLSEVARRSGCGILLDVNNIYVNSKNHLFDPLVYVENIPAEKIGQIHVAGHTDMGSYLFDTHSKPVIEPVWELYRKTLERAGQVSTLIEWDDDIPEFSRLQEEAAKAKAIYVLFEKPKTPVPVFKKETAAAPQVSGRSLAEIQESMKAWIKPHENQPADAMARELNPQGGAAGCERLSIYGGGYFARFYEGLSEVYEAVHFILGDHAFRHLNEAYALRYPSKEYNLSLAGKYLPEFLEDSPLSKERPYLPELARFEWRIAEAFHAYDREPFQISQLASVPIEQWENARLTFQPSVSIFSSKHPVLDIWKQRKEADKPRDPWPLQEQFILIGRRGLQVRCELLDPVRYQLLKGLMSGKSLGEVCETLAEDTPEDLPIAAWFSSWVTDGLIADCRLEAAGKEN